MHKHRKDNDVEVFCLRHLLAVKDGAGEGQGRDVVALSALHPITHQDIHTSKVVGRITGDAHANKLGWSVTNPDLGEAMAIPMPPPMQEAISKAGLLPDDHTSIATAYYGDCRAGSLSDGSITVGAHNVMEVEILSLGSYR